MIPQLNLLHDVEIPSTTLDERVRIRSAMKLIEAEAGEATLQHFELINRLEKRYNKLRAKLRGIQL